MFFKALSILFIVYIDDINIAFKEQYKPDTIALFDGIKSIYKLLSSE